ncbi:MAG TPA: phosphoenolpyruvate carboxykinase domain-containing protein, partial [Methylomirabilota bacterium]|nr:phosphoenolpyruvate carboxykinase domain-containing protein [Methylomirabilota bacterium]
SFGARLKNPPRIFRVNWFRRDAEGRFLWPGYGENVRILKWIVERIHGGGRAVETPIGLVPAPGAIDCAGLELPEGALDAALHVDREEWRQALEELREFYEQFGGRMPAAIWQAHAETTRRFGL